MFIEKIFGKQDIKLGDIKNLLDNHTEHRDLEFKESVDKNKFIKPIVGMANANGGLLIIGVEDNGKIKGIKTEHGYKEKLNNWIKDIEPSLSNHYNIIQIKLDEENSLYLVEVEPAVGLHAFKDKHFIYYIRKGPSTEEINPNEIIKIATQKESYIYNHGYRKGLLGSIDNAVQEIARFLGIRKADFIKLIGEKNIEQLIIVIKNAKTKDLNINIYQEILHLNLNILHVNEQAPHKDLTLYEDDLRIEILDAIKHAYDFNKKLNESDIEVLNSLPIYWLNNKKFNELDNFNIFTSLSLTGFIKNTYGYSDFLHNNLQKYINNYEDNLNYITENLNLIYKGLKISKEIILDLKEMLEKFPIEMAKELIIIINIALSFKKVIEDALYLNY